MVFSTWTRVRPYCFPQSVNNLRYSPYEADLLASNDIPLCARSQPVIRLSRMGAAEASSDPRWQNRSRAIW